MRSNSFTTQLMSVLKDKIRAQGITQDLLSVKMKVSLPTVKRWLAGKSVTVNNLKRLCDVLGIGISELALEVEDARPPRATYTIEQEEYLAFFPDALAYFDMLVRGRSVRTITEKFNLSKVRTERYLSALEKIGLIDWLPHNRVRLRLKGEPTWAKDGPLARRFKAEILTSFLEERQNGFFSLNEFLPEDADSISAKVNDLALAIRQANRRALLMPSQGTPYGAFLLLKPFRWHLDEYLRRK